MEALAEAEAAARQVAATRSDTQATINELSSLVGQFGLDVAVPREPRPDPADSKLAGLLGSLLRDVGHSQVIEQALATSAASARRQAKAA